MKKIDELIKVLEKIYLRIKHLRNGETDAKFSLLSNTLLFIMPILAILGTLFPLILGKPNLSLLGFYLAIPMFLSSIIYRKQKRHLLKYASANKNLFSIYISSYLLLLSVSVILLYIYNIRPYTYYFVISMMSTILVLEILTFENLEKQVNIILFQIMLLVLDILWGVTLKYDYFFQRTDPLAHIYMIQSLANNYHVTNIFGIYKPFPLWHILCVFLYEVLSISYNDINKLMFFTNGLVYSFIIPITYLIVNRVTNNKQISLLTSLFLAINPDFINYGMASIPRSVVTFLELVFILFLLDSRKAVEKSLSFLVISSIIIYHTVSSPFLIVIFLGIYLLQKIFVKKADDIFIKAQSIILIVIISFYYWIYYANTLFKSLIENVFIPSSSLILTKSVLYTPLAELFNYLQYSPLALFIFVGFYEATNSKKMSTLGKIFCIMGLIGVATAFPGPVLLFNKFGKDFNIMRFGEYLSIFISVCAAVGLFTMYLKARVEIKTFIIILFFLLSFLTVSNDFVASDNPLVKRTFFTFYFTNEEITSFNKIASISTGYIMSDYVTNRYFNFSQYADIANILEVNPNNMELLRNNSEDLIIVRDGELTKRPLRLYTSKKGVFFLKPDVNDLTYYYNDHILWNDLKKYNNVYSSNNVKAYC